MDVANLPPCPNTGRSDNLCCPGYSDKAVRPTPPLPVLLPGLTSSLDHWPALGGTSPGKDPSSPIEIFPMHSISQCWTPGNPFPLAFIIIIGNFLFLCFLSLLLRSWKKWVTTLDPNIKSHFNLAFRYVSGSSHLQLPPQAVWLDLDQNSLKWVWVLFWCCHFHWKSWTTCILLVKFSWGQLQNRWSEILSLQTALQPSKFQQ